MAQAWDYPDTATLTGFSFLGSIGEEVLNCTIATLDARYGGGTEALLKVNNLSDLTSVPTARTNLGLGSAALLASTALLLVANNLSDLASAATARTNLGATATGASLFTAANAAAGRSALSLGTLATANTISNLDWSGQALSVGNGGTGQTTASAGFGALSPLTTKGDLIGYDTGANVRIAVGANGTVLTAASGSTGGFAWSTPASTSAQYVVAASDSTLSAEKVLTAGSGISVSIAGTDAGTATIAIQSNAVTNAMLATMSDQRMKGNISGGTANPSDLTSAQVTAFLTSFVGDSGSGGTKGLVPAPASGDAAANKVLGAGGGWVAQSGSGGAPTDATYLTLTLNATLTNERTLALASEITGTDAGAGSTYTLSLTAAGIANSKLANVATATFKGRTTGGTGAPEDLTVTQATALLNAFVGDSGSGGTKGLVPAPASGDAAAGKFLKADGTWDTPAGGGGVSLSSTNPWTGVNSFTITDAVTNSVTTCLTLAHATSGTAAAAFGAGLAYNLENASGTTTASMSLNAVFSTATGGSENVDFSVALKAAGVAPAEKFKVTSAGVASAGGTTLLKESRTLAVTNGVTIDGATSTLDLSANRTIGFSDNVLSLITPDPGADFVGFWDTSGSVMGKCLMQNVRVLESWIFAIGPENSGTAVSTVTLVKRAPYAFQVTAVTLSARLHSSSYNIVGDISTGITSVTATSWSGGTSILTTAPILTTTTTTSLAGTPAVVKAGALAQFTADQQFGISVQYASGATTANNAGTAVTIIGYRV